MSFHSLNASFYSVLKVTFCRGYHRALPVFPMLCVHPWACLIPSSLHQWVPLPSPSPVVTTGLFCTSVSPLLFMLYSLVCCNFQIPYVISCRIFLYLLSLLNCKYLDLFPYWEFIIERRPRDVTLYYFLKIKGLF